MHQGQCGYEIIGQCGPKQSKLIWNNKVFLAVSSCIFFSVPTTPHIPSPHHPIDPTLDQTLHSHPINCTMCRTHKVYKEMYSCGWIECRSECRQSTKRHPVVLLPRPQYWPYWPPGTGPGPGPGYIFLYQAVSIYYTFHPGSRSCCKYFPNIFFRYITKKYLELILRATFNWSP